MKTDLERLSVLHEMHKNKKKRKKLNHLFQDNK